MTGKIYPATLPLSMILDPMTLTAYLLKKNEETTLSQAVNEIYFEKTKQICQKKRFKPVEFRIHKKRIYHEFCSPDKSHYFNKLIVECRVKRAENGIK